MKYTTYKNVAANVPMSFIAATFFQALEVALQGLFSAINKQNDFYNGGCSRNFFIISFSSYSGEKDFATSQI